MVGHLNTSSTLSPMMLGFHMPKMEITTEVIKLAGLDSIDPSKIIYVSLMWKPTLLSEKMEKEGGE